jgi:hypothetical protein
MYSGPLHAPNSRLQEQLPQLQPTLVRTSRRALPGAPGWTTEGAALLLHDHQKGLRLAQLAVLALEAIHWCTAI